MKRIILFFTVCLGLSVSQTTSVDAAETIRATASKRGTPTATTTQSNVTSGRAVATTTNTKRADSNTTKNTRTAAKPQQRVVSRTTTTAQAAQNVRARQTTNVKTPATTSTTTQQRLKTTSRVATPTRTATSRAGNATTTGAKTTTAKSSRTVAGTKSTTTKSRAAVLNTEKIADIKSLNYSKCKTVYNECMDEFCANKDANLRRCACSSRIHEFDGLKKQLANAEDKMLDFNQRLLTVNLDKEDAAAINVASEGEAAFTKKDNTESEKLLQKITRVLNTSGDSKINNELSAVSLSLDMDTAWDDVDAMSGIATSSKSGLDLYNAALPICIEMAREVCNDDELKIAQSGYTLTIEQDCNTVAKSYETLYNNAKTKINESSALLDMARLNAYQQRNSDDTLTCKKKILAQLSDTAVCGENLYKCLDTTGQYIDPSTGAAFLSTELYNLTSLIQEPGVDERWSKVAQNENFVNFLNSKKEFLEPAMYQCQDMSDTIWKEFLDDALAQIKLAQNNKLDEIRHSCTTLVAECKTDALKSLAEFDARALSTFSVAADKTANEMCSSVETACVSLMNYSGMSGDWAEGMAGISHDVTLKTLIDTCTNVGHDCIVQQCNGTSGNFSLCQTTNSDIRISILKEESCYNEIKECIMAGDGMLTSNQELTTEASDLLAEIWGNCEENKGMLSWFASNTGNTSCDTTGGIQVDDDAKVMIAVTSALQNVCTTGVLDIYGNCCESGLKSNGICLPSTDYTQAAYFQTLACSSKKPAEYFCSRGGNMKMYCLTGNAVDTPVEYNPNNGQYTCRNSWLIVDDFGNYFYMPKIVNDVAKYDSTTPMYYYEKFENNNNVEPKHHIHRSASKWVDCIGDGCTTTNVDISDVNSDPDLIIKSNYLKID